MVVRRRGSASIVAGAWWNLVVGLLIAAVPFVTGAEGLPFWFNFFVGFTVALLAGFNAWAASNLTTTVAWTAGANLVLGVGVAISPFVLAAGPEHGAANIVLGILLALVAASNAWNASGGASRVGRPGI